MDFTTIEFTLSNKDIKRFYSKLSIQDNNGCINWIGPLRGKGYGYMNIDRSKIKSNRIAWQIKNGPIPKGKLVLHKCDNPKCCNPDHLYLGNFGDNMTDRCSRTTVRMGRVTDLTEHDINRITELYKNGKTQKSIAKELGFTQSYISMLINKQRGKNLS